MPVEIWHANYFVITLLWLLDCFFTWCADIVALEAASAVRVPPRRDLWPRVHCGCGGSPSEVQSGRVRVLPAGGLGMGRCFQLSDAQGPIEDQWSGEEPKRRSRFLPLRRGRRRGRQSKRGSMAEPIRRVKGKVKFP